MGFSKIATLSALLSSSLAWAAPIEDNAVVQFTPTPLPSSNTAASPKPTSTAIALNSAALDSMVASWTEHGPRASGYPRATAVHSVATSTPTDPYFPLPISAYPPNTELYYDDLTAQYEILLMEAHVLELQYVENMEYLVYEDKNATALYKELNQRLELMWSHERSLMETHEGTECVNSWAEITCSYRKPSDASVRCEKEIGHLEGLVVEQRNLVADDVKLWTQWLEDAQSDKDVKKIVAKSEAVEAVMERIESILVNAGREVPGREEDDGEDASAFAALKLTGHHAINTDASRTNTTSPPTDTPILVYGPNGTIIVSLNGTNHLSSRSVNSTQTSAPSNKAELKAPLSWSKVSPTGDREYRIPLGYKTPDELESFLSDVMALRDMIMYESMPLYESLEELVQQLNIADKAFVVANRTRSTLKDRVEILAYTCSGKLELSPEPEWRCETALREVEAEYEEACLTSEAAEAKVQALREALERVKWQVRPIERDLDELNDFIVYVKGVIKEAKVKAITTTTQILGYAKPTTLPVNTPAALPTYAAVDKRDYINTADLHFQIPPGIKSAKDLSNYLNGTVMQTYSALKQNLTLAQQNLDNTRTERLAIAQQTESLQSARQALKQQVEARTAECHSKLVYQGGCRIILNTMQAAYDQVSARVGFEETKLKELDVGVEKAEREVDGKKRELVRFEGFIQEVKMAIEKAKEKEAASGIAARGYVASSTAGAAPYATSRVECLSSHACFPVDDYSNTEAVARQA